MKSFLKKTLFLTITIFAFVASVSFAQDKITLLSGEVKQGKITGITETVIKLRYPSEDFDYEIDKKSVAKIEFSSGRTEIINNQGPLIPTSPKPSGPIGTYDAHNKIAVLPFEFVTNDPGMTVESMRTLTQNNTANIVKKEYGLLTIQDPITTNAILAKNNINHGNISGFAPEELAHLLGVEFVIFGMVNIVNNGSTTQGSSVASYKEKENNNSQGNSDNKNSAGTAVVSTSSSTKIDYDTTVDFRLFNDRGENLYSESRHSFGSSIDSYRGSIQYMVRRTPFGSKYGKK
jgi:hypothetical protein